MTEKKNKSELRRLTVSFGKEYQEEFEKLMDEPRASQTVCKALRLYYNRHELPKQYEETLDEKFDIITSMLLEIKKNTSK